MTCIVGIIQKGKTYIGGDSAGVGNGYQAEIRKDVKVFRVDDFVIGCTTSFRMIQLLRYSLSLPKKHPDVDIYKYMCTDFINTVRKCFRDGGFVEIDKNVERGGTFLVGWQDRLFTIYDDYQVAEMSKGYDAVGCGQAFALGGLDAMDSALPAEERINKVLEIATYRSAGVRPPFIIEHT